VAWATWHSMRWLQHFFLAELDFAKLGLELPSYAQQFQLMAREQGPAFSVAVEQMQWPTWLVPLQHIQLPFSLLSASQEQQLPFRFQSIPLRRFREVSTRRLPQRFGQLAPAVMEDCDNSFIRRNMQCAMCEQLFESKLDLSYITSRRQHFQCQ